MQSLIINFLLYLLVFIWAYKKAGKRFTFYNLSIALFVFYSFFGVFSYATGIYSDTFHDNGVMPLKPLLICFVMIVVMYYPLYKTNKEEFEIKPLYLYNQGRIDFLCKILFFVFVVNTFAMLVATLSILESGKGLADMYQDFHDEGLSSLNLSSWQNIIIWNTLPIRNAFTFFCLFVALLKIDQGYNKRFWWALIVITLMPDILMYIMRSARGEFMYLAFKLLLTYVLLRKYLSNRTKKTIKKSLLLICCIGAFYSILITLDRFEDTAHESNETLVRYFGETFPNLSNMLWDNVKHHPMGVRLLPTYLIGVDVPSIKMSVGENHEFWASITGVPILNFKTIFGDLYVDFGAIGACIIMGLICLLFLFFLPTNKLTLYRMPFFYIIMHLVTMAPTYLGTITLQQLIYCIASSVFLYYYLQPQNRG